MTDLCMAGAPDSEGRADTPALEDQLLRAIELDDEDNHGGFRCQSIDALRAVVELHAPVPWVRLWERIR